MVKALRAEINDVVVKYTERKLRKDGTLDVAVMAHEMTQSLVVSRKKWTIGKADLSHRFRT